MTEKQASTWVEENCRFAAVQNSRNAIRTAASKAGVDLTDEQADFHVVKAAVMSAIKTAGVADQLSQILPGQDINKIIEDAVAKSGQNVVAATTEVLNRIKEIGESMKRTRPDFVIPTLGYDTIRRINQAVREYLQTADPAELFNRHKAVNPSKVGPNVSEPRSRLSVPAPTSGRAPTTQPNPHNRPIPRQPFPNPLPA